MKHQSVSDKSKKKTLKFLSTEKCWWSFGSTIRFLIFSSDLLLKEREREASSASETSKKSGSEDACRRPTLGPQNDWKIN